jgi:hypothetical protein
MPSVPILDEESRNVGVCQSGLEAPVTIPVTNNRAPGSANERSRSARSLIYAGGH